MTEVDFVETRCAICGIADDKVLFPEKLHSDTFKPVTPSAPGARAAGTLPNRQMLELWSSSIQSHIECATDRFLVR